jgi:hypothetical protein
MPARRDDPCRSIVRLLGSGVELRFEFKGSSTPGADAVVILAPNVGAGRSVSALVSQPHNDGGSDRCTSDPLAPHPTMNPTVFTALYLCTAGENLCDRHY